MLQGPDAARRPDPGWRDPTQVGGVRSARRRPPVIVPRNSAKRASEGSAHFVLLGCGMTQPRRVRPGMTVMVTRRTLRRTHLLRPDSEFNGLYKYCLQVIAERHGIEVHAAVVMSTHEHLVLTDVSGQLPRFLQELHRLVALHVKLLRKWEGAVWDHEKTSVVELRTTQAVVEALAYVMANPVAAGLVKGAAEWPGVMTLPHELGRAAWTVRRPSQYFCPDNPAWPETTTLTLTGPRVDISADELRAAVQVELQALERQAHDHVRANGGNFIGRSRLATLSPLARAKSWEPLRSRNPTFAVGRGQRDEFMQAVAAIRDFREAYRSALRRWRSGLRDAVFPAETWLMRWVHGASTAS